MSRGVTSVAASGVTSVTSFNFVVAQLRRLRSVAPGSSTILPRSRDLATNSEDHVATKYALSSRSRLRVERKIEIPPDAYRRRVDDMRAWMTATMRR